MKVWKIALVLVLVLLAGSYIWSRLISESRTTVLVLVAKRDLPPETALGDPKDAFEEQWILKRDVPPDAMVPAQSDHLRGRILKVGLKRGDLVTPRHLHPPDTEKRNQ